MTRSADRFRFEICLHESYTNTSRIGERKKEKGLYVSLYWNNYTLNYIPVIPTYVREMGIGEGERERERERGISVFPCLPSPPSRKGGRALLTLRLGNPLIPIFSEGEETSMRLRMKRVLLFSFPRVSPLLPLPSSLTP